MLAFCAQHFGWPPEVTLGLDLYDLRLVMAGLDLLEGGRSRTPFGKRPRVQGRGSISFDGPDKDYMDSVYTRRGSGRSEVM